MSERTREKKGSRRSKARGKLHERLNQQNTHAIRFGSALINELACINSLKFASYKPSIGRFDIVQMVRATVYERA